MAKRTDFTQKLLDDLRMRKERMAKPHMSNRSNQMSADKYQNFKQSSRGSRQINPHETIGTSSRDTRKWLGTGNKSLTINEPSKEIVTVGRGRSTEHIADLSMAIAFALNNGRNVRKMDSSSNPMASFMQNFGRRSVNFGEMDRRGLDRSRPPSGRFPTLSHLHIKEISKGAQKLNQILMACCNGVNFDKYSIDIGRELLKGAMDLEESLKLLVDLHEASEYMVTPRKKNQIRLIEVDDDDEEVVVEVNKKNQLGRPKFSFDGPSRNSLEDVTKTSLLKQRLLALSYSTEAPIASSHSVSHRRSPSGDRDSSIVSVFSSPKKHSNSSNSQAEKGRIPNVIAKLMGLDALPPNTESKNGAPKDTRVKQGTKAGKDSKKSFQESTKKVEPMIMMRANKTSANAYTADVKPMSSSKKSAFDRAQLNQNTEIMINKQEKMRRQENPNLKEQKSHVRAETKEQVLKDDFQRTALQTHKHSDAADVKHEKVGTKETGLQKEKKNVYNRLLMASNQTKLQHDVLRISKSQDAKLPTLERKHLNAKNKLEVKTRKGSEMMLKSSSKVTNEVMNLQKKLSHVSRVVPSKKSYTEAFVAMSSKGYQESNHSEDLDREGNSTKLKLNMKKSPRETESEVESVAHTQKKVDGTQGHKSVNPRKIHEVVIRENSSPQHMSKPLKQPKISVLQEPKLRRENRIRSKEAEVSINTSKEASIQPLNFIQDLQKSSEGEEYQRPKETKTLPSKANIQDITTKVSDSLQDSTISVYKNQPLESSEVVSVQTKGLHEHNVVGSSESLQHEQQKILKSENRASLSEDESHLKEILIKSQLFLNAAEALFRLHIPVGILHDSSHKYQDDEDSKLILDCGYEVMRRKGRRQEVSFHSFATISIGSVKVKCLDDLVKELYKDLDMLKFSAESWGNEYDAADCLHNMLHEDIQNKNPDVNCMWDFGWSNTMFEYLEEDEIVKDVEKYVLNGLIDELTRDFLHVSIVVD